MLIDNISTFNPNLKIEKEWEETKKQCAQVSEKQLTWVLEGNIFLFYKVLGVSSQDLWPLTWCNFQVPTFISHHHHHIDCWDVMLICTSYTIISNNIERGCQHWALEEQPPNKIMSFQEFWSFEPKFQQHMIYIHTNKILKLSDKGGWQKLMGR